MTTRLLRCAATLMLAAAPAAGADDFLVSLYDRLHDSPVQRNYRDLAPMPFGVVFLPWKA